MNLSRLWKSIKNVLGFNSKSEQRLPMPQADRWSRMLKALQVAPHALMPALDRELARGLDASERLIRPKKEGVFFDGLMVGKKLDVLDLLCSKLDPDAVSERVMGKVPSLRDWALGNLGESSLTRGHNAEAVAWARNTGRFKKGVLRDSLLAEAIEGGRHEMAKRELQDAGMKVLDSGDMDRYMEAFAQRKEAGLSAGLDAEGLEAFAQSLGGWGELSEAAAGLSFDKLMDLVANLLEALAEESLMEEKVLERAKATASKKTREIIARAVALQAAKSDRPIALKAAIESRADAMGVSAEKAGRGKLGNARILVGKMDVSMAIEGGVSLYEVAKLSRSEGSCKVIEAISSVSASISPERMSALVGDAEKAVRSLVMRSSGEAREATKAWRETVKQWKNGELGGASLSQMQELVREKTQEQQNSSGDRPKGPKGH